MQKGKWSSDTQFVEQGSLSPWRGMDEMVWSTSARFLKTLASLVKTKMQTRSLRWSTSALSALRYVTHLSACPSRRWGRIDFWIRGPVELQDWVSFYRLHRHLCTTTGGMNSSFVWDSADIHAGVTLSHMFQHYCPARGTPRLPDMGVAHGIVPQIHTVAPTLLPGDGACTSRSGESSWTSSSTAAGA